MSGPPRRRSPSWLLLAAAALVLGAALWVGSAVAPIDGALSALSHSTSGATSASDSATDDPEHVVALAVAPAPLATAAVRSALARAVGQGAVRYLLWLLVLLAAAAASRRARPLRRSTRAFTPAILTAYLPDRRGPPRLG